MTDNTPAEAPVAAWERPRPLEGKRALVTGGASGIGAAVRGPSPHGARTWSSRISMKPVPPRWLMR